MSSLVIVFDVGLHPRGRIGQQNILGHLLHKVPQMFDNVAGGAFGQERVTIEIDKCAIAEIVGELLQGSD